MANDTTKTLYTRISNLSFLSTGSTASGAKWAGTEVLLKGEIGFESDTNKMKVGDGVTTWANLPYANPDLPIATESVLGGIKSSTGVGAVTVNSSTGVASVAEVAEAQALSTARTIAVSGDVAGSASFDGSANITIAVTGSDATTSAHGFMSAADKTKLDGISTGANKVEASVTNGNIKIDGNETTVYTLPVADADTVGGIKSGDILTVSAAGAPSFADAVASEAGVGGSHGLMTAAQAEKLAGIATGAQVNVLEGVSFKGSRATEFSDLTIVNKKAQLDLSNYPTFDDLGSALNFRGDKTGDQLAALTVSDVKNGDVYQCTADDSGSPVTFHANMEYAAVVSGDPAALSWVELGNWVDLSGYVQKTQTVNNKALSGNIVLDGSDIALTGYAKASAAAAVAATDTVNQAIGKLEYKLDNEIDTARDAAIAAAIEGLDVADIGGSGKMITTVGEADGEITATAVDLVTTIGDSASSTVPATASAVKSYVDGKVAALDYTDSVSGDYVTSVSETDGVIAVTKGTKGSIASGDTGLVDGGTVYTAIDGAVSGKADKVSSATSGNFAGLDANGNLTDSGSKASDFATATALSTHVNNGDIHVTADQKTAWTAKYDKPADGIPSTDMTSAVQSSLAAADTAVQTVTGDTYVSATKSGTGVTLETSSKVVTTDNYVLLQCTLTGIPS